MHMYFLNFPSVMFANVPLAKQISHGQVQIQGGAGEKQTLPLDGKNNKDTLHMACFSLLNLLG